uniref:Male-enhanced antigen 1 n=1 Tax=Acanthochromis polyacanthus TaxID=80966 RepID=A0A3Q1FWB7_9TELE
MQSPRSRQTSVGWVDRAAFRVTRPASNRGLPWRLWEGPESDIPMTVQRLGDVGVLLTTVSAGSGWSSGRRPGVGSGPHWRPHPGATAHRGEIRPATSDLGVRKSPVSPVCLPQVMGLHLPEAPPPDSDEEEDPEGAAAQRSRASIPMDADHVELVKRTMASVALPSLGVPPWAREISDDQWKDMVQHTLQSRQNATPPDWLSDTPQLAYEPPEL